VLLVASTPHCGPLNPIPLGSATYLCFRIAIPIIVAAVGVDASASTGERDVASVGVVAGGGGVDVVAAAGLGLSHGHRTEQYWDGVSLSGPEPGVPAGKLRIPQRGKPVCITAAPAGPQELAAVHGTAAYGRTHGSGGQRVPSDITCITSRTPHSYRNMKHGGKNASCPRPGSQ
jgi:hypothetical protein